MKELAKTLGLALAQVNTYMGHYTLNKYVIRGDRDTGRRLIKCRLFIVCPESIAALYEYMQAKKAYSGKRNKFNIAKIYKLKKLYDKSTSNDVVKNEN